ncbi:hypothetical protein KAR91_54015 [Candidatus Pacearchaeota archaeon]|nr:hypothetical protein [Candidatus Pacearchaeota archaeon]
MGDMFGLDITDLLVMRKIWRKAPRKFKRATAGVLTTFAKGTQKEAQKQIKKNFTLRSEKFVLSTIRVDFARGNQSVNAQRAEVGSVPRGRFGGLAEQELGRPSEKDRVPTLRARRGSFSNKVKPGAKLRKTGSMFDPWRDLPNMKSDKQRNAVMFIRMRREGMKRKIIMRKRMPKKTGFFERGLYEWSNNKLRKLQEFGNKLKPKRVRWLTRGRVGFMRKLDVRKVWAKELKHVFKT